VPCTAPVTAILRPGPAHSSRLAVIANRCFFIFPVAGRLSRVDQSHHDTTDTGRLEVFLKVTDHHQRRQSGQTTGYPLTHDRRPPPLTSIRVCHTKHVVPRRQQRTGAAAGSRAHRQAVRVAHLA